MLDEVRVFSVAAEMFVPLYEQFSKRYQRLRGLLWPYFARRIPPVCTLWVEVILYDKRVKSLLHTEGHVLRTLVLESEVKEADRPTRVTIINCHQILLELFHSLGQKPCCSMMPLRMLLCHLVVLCQAVVQLEVADEFQSREEMSMVEIGSLQLSLQHFHDDDPLLFPQPLNFFDGDGICELLHHSPNI